MLRCCLFGAVFARDDGPPVKIVALGDSLTAGYGLPRDRGVSGTAASALKAKGIAVEIANAGVSGDTRRAGSAGSTGRCRTAPRP